MAGGGQEGPAVCEVELGVQAADEAARVQVDQLAVGLREGLRRRGPRGGLGADGEAATAHECGGGDIVALDVADDCGRGGVVHPDQVVEVAADLHTADAGQVTGGHIQSGKVRQRVGEHGRLQNLRELLAGVVQAGPFQRLRDQSRECGHNGPLVAGELVGPVEGEHAQAHRAPGGDQRQVGPGLQTVLAGGERVGAYHLLKGGEEVRHAVGEGADRSRGGERRSVEELHGIGVVAPTTDEA